MASLKDIAGVMNVSESLVSKVLNNRLGTSSVRPETAAAIRATAERMGYRPNKSASALAAGRQQVLGAIVHRDGTEGSGLAETTVYALADAAETSDQRLWLNFITSNDEMRALLSKAHRGAIDGLIIAGIPHREVTPDLVNLERSGLPIVTVHDQPLHPSLPNVGMDEVEIGRRATVHLIERGCRRIAHIPVRAGRYEGYQTALREHGLKADPALVCDGVGYYLVDGEAAATRLLDAGVPFDGLVCQSDEQAMGAMRTLMRRGVRIPDDVRLIGVDDSPYCALAMVGLSSVSQQLDQRARRAVALLMQRIDHPSAAVGSISVEPVVMVRDSSR